ncbi:hypothetical protein E4U21_007091 [Claviceps maximensis]|nr:hypothetical protein E4U21_007091 [Claviceps maximensis]
MTTQSNTQSAVTIVVPPDFSRNPIEKLAYELLCQEYRSRYATLSQAQQAEFWNVFQRIVIKPYMYCASHHILGNRRRNRIPNMAEFEFFAILYGIRACSTRKWFREYAADHPDVLNPRFKGIISQIDNSAFVRIIENRQQLPPISMEKVSYRDPPRLSRGQLPLQVFFDTERSSTASTPSTSSSRHSSASSASLGSSGSSSRAASSAAVIHIDVDKIDVNDSSDCSIKDESSIFVEEILAPSRNVGSTSTSKHHADLAQIVAELQSREASNTMAVNDLHHALVQFKERLISFGDRMYSLERASDQMDGEITSLGRSHYTLKQEQTELQQSYAQLCETMKSPAA